MKRNALLRVGLLLGLGLLPLSPVFAQEEPIPEQQEFGLGGEKAIAESPDDQLVELGQAAVFTAGDMQKDVSYQWLRRQRDEWEVLPEQTESTLEIPAVTLADVAHYQCIVRKENRVQMTRPASLMVQSASSGGTGGFSALSGGSPITVFAPPVTSSGSLGSCPGSYVGYVTFFKSAPDWGWAPSTNTTTHIAEDLSQTNTIVRYQGKSYDVGCAPTQVTVPSPTVSTKYRFAIYFPTTVPGTNAYPITLTGFDP